MQTIKTKQKDIITFCLIPTIVMFIYLLVNKILFGSTNNLYSLIMVLLISYISTFQYLRDKSILNPLFYFPILYFLLYWIGNFDFFGLYPDVPIEIWRIYLIGLLGFYLGCFFIDKLNIDRKTAIKPIDMMSHEARVILFAIFLVCLISKSIIFLKNGIPMLAQNIDASRQNAAENFGILKVISSAYPILAIYFFYDYVLTVKNYQKKKMLNILVLSISILLALLEGSRLLIIQMAIPMLFIWDLKIKKINIKKLAFLFLGVLFFIGANKFLRNSLENNEYYSYVMASRGNSLFENIMISSFSSFRVGIDCFRQLVEVVPHYSSYTYGRMFINSISSFLPGKQIIIGYYVAELLGLNFDGMGAATTILGLFYLDGGPFLVFLGMLLFGLFIQYNYKKSLITKNVSLVNLVSIYIAYYSIYCLRTNVMPNIDPLLTMFYYWVFSIIIKKVRR